MHCHLWNGGYKMKIFLNILKSKKGIGVIEIVLILLVLVGLVVIFRSQLTSMMTSIFTKVNAEIKNF